jgi:outer membrane protein OmpA-like peptidoglycan-associated protein
VTVRECVHLVACAAGLIFYVSAARAQPPYLVLFEYGRSDISALGQAVLDQVVSDFKRVDTGPILLTGHTDRSGAAAANMELSRRRIEAVRVALIAAGLPKTEIFTRAVGEEEPLVLTPDGVREMVNRCVEVWIPWSDVIVEKPQ